MIKNQTITANVSFGLHSGDKWIIQVGDNDANVQLFELEFTPEQFAFALGHRYLSDIPLHINNLDVIGKRVEHKHESVPKYVGEQDDIEAQKQHLAPYMVDGWKPRIADLTNHHRMNGNLTTVGFSRWVEKDDSKV